MAKEILTAIVSRNNDDKGLGRIRVKCQALAPHDAELPHWVEPILPFAGDGFGFFAIPEPGDEVEIELYTSHDDDEIPGEVILSGAKMRYRATVYSAGTDAPDQMKAKRVGFVTRAGHYLVFNDEENKEKLTINIAGKGDVTIIAPGTVKLGTDDASEALALASKTKQDLQTLKSAFDAWTVVSQDGGAALKTQLGTSLANWPSDHGSKKVKASE